MKRVFPRRARPGQVKPSLLRGMKTDVARSEIEPTMAEAATVHMTHDSWHWAIRVEEERERVMPVTVYDGEGRVIRVIQKAELMARPSQDEKYRENYHLFVNRSV